MNRMMAWMGVAGVIALTGCAGGRAEEDAHQAPDTHALKSAVKEADAAGLAHPEFDLAVRTDEFVYFGSRPASEISDKMTENFRLISISAASATTFNATLIRNIYPYERPGNAWQSGMTEAELLARYADSNIRIVDIASYMDGTDRRYAAVWLDNTAAQIDYQLLLHETAANFITLVSPNPMDSADLGYRVIDVETQPIPGDPSNYEVSGVAIKNVDPATYRVQTYGYGPLAGTVAAPPMPTSPQPMSVSTGVTTNYGRMADLSSPFGDGNFFWVVEENLDNKAASPNNRPSSNCETVDEISTERNWWFAEHRIEAAPDSPQQEDYMRHLIFRYGARTGKLKSYVSQMAGAVRYVGVMYDNGVPGLPDGAPDPNPTANKVIAKIDAAFQNRMKRWGIPGGALALTNNGQLVFAKGYGYADLSVDPPRLARADDSFRVASVSKAIAQSVLLRLIHEDAMLKNVQDVNGDPVTVDTTPFGLIFADYDPPFVGSSETCAVDDPSPTADISGCTLGHVRIRDLLYHTSGLLTANDTTSIGGAEVDARRFSNDGPGANTHEKWNANELYLSCETDPGPGICVRPGAFVAPPGVRNMYMNTEYQIILEIIEKLLPEGETYQSYLAEILAPIGVQRMRAAHLEGAPDVSPVVQARPYSLPMPFCYWDKQIPPTPEADGFVDLGPSSSTHGFLGSASIATSMVDLVRWATALDGTRGGPQLLGSTVFAAEFRGPGNIPGADFALPFEHGGLFNFDTQAIVRMDSNGVDYAFAANGDSQLCGLEYCCNGTTTCNDDKAALSCAAGVSINQVFKYTHDRPANVATIDNFDVEVRNDIESILNSPGFCASKLPAIDLFSSYLPTEPHAACKDAEFPAGPSCTVTLTTSDIDAGSTGGPLALTTGAVFTPGEHDVGLQVDNAYGSSVCGSTLKVTDSSAPVITPPGAVTTPVCFGGGLVSIGQATATDNCSSTQPSGSIITKDGVSITPIPVLAGNAFLTPGVYGVRWTVSDGTFTVDASQTVTVTADATLPVVTAPANVTQKICQTAALTNVGYATATDNCPATLTVTGQVIATNGVTLPTPITIASGTPVNLGIGTHTIKWTANDGFNNSLPVNQTATLTPTIEASLSFDVQDRAQVRATTGFAAIFNAGSSFTKVGQDGRTGAIYSLASVDVLQRAIVDGTITSHGEIDVNPTATAGTQFEGATVVLPALPALPTFPAATGGGFTVNSGTRNQAPGSYTSVSLNAGTLVLQAGDYYFQSLTLNSNGTIRVSPNTRIFVRDTLVFNTTFKALTGSAVQPLYFGFAGTTLSLPIRFDGVLVAPNATVSFGSGSGVTFTGSFFGRRLQVNPASALVCLP